MLSFWEKETLTHYDIIVLGSGFVGLHSALQLRKRFPKQTIGILDRGLLPYGASTRNAGFACFGSLSELVEDLHLLGEEGMLELVNKRWQGISRMKNLLGTKTIDYHDCGGYEVIFENDLNYLDELSKINDILRRIFQDDVFEWIDAQKETIPFSNPSIKGLIKNPYEGQLHPGKAIKVLRNLAQKSGIDIITGALVTNFKEYQDIVFISLEQHPYQFTANVLVMCTNAFTPQLLNLEQLEPGRGLVILTEPIDDLEMEGTFHIDRGYYYFRNLENRILLGGGRNLDFYKENTTVQEINFQILEHLQSILFEYIYPKRKLRIEQAWTGIMAFGDKKEPIVKKITDKCYCAVRMGGMGVALSAIVGEEVAELVSIDHTY